MAESKKTPGTEAKKKADALGVWIALGAGVGLALGVIFGQIALGIALGAGAGIVIGSVLASRGNGARGSPRP
jgi:threonine/homoserine efflux transporter RhtA